MEDLNGLRVALMDRSGSELARAVRRRGGVVCCVPVLRQSCADCDGAASAFLALAARGSFGAFIFRSADDARVLLREAERLGWLDRLLPALRSTRTVCGAPMPAAVLAEQGVTASAQAAEPYTNPEILTALDSLELSDQCVAVVYYGERDPALAAALGRRSFRCRELALNEALLPHEVLLLETLVQQLALGQTDSMIFVHHSQPGYLFQVARRMVLAQEVASACNGAVAAVALNRASAAALRLAGVTPRVVMEDDSVAQALGLLARLPAAAARADGTKMLEISGQTT